MQNSPAKVTTGSPPTASVAPLLQDRFGRHVDYVRLSVTDRCDFRCVYCMAEEMTFLPRADILSLEQLFQVGKALVEMGVRKIRLTGGEPLVRRNVVALVEQLAALPGLDELTMTTNGSQLVKFAQPLKAAGLSRLNISLDSLNAERFRSLTRTGDLKQVLAGIEAAREAGFSRTKLNSVILRGRNDDEVIPLVSFARERGLDISFIEEMPLGAIDEHDRSLSFVSSSELRTLIDSQWPLTPSTESTPGPSRYWRFADTDTRVGFISPHSNNFCHLCNRVRVTVEGRMLLCLGNEHSMDLKPILDNRPDDDEALKAAITQAIELKPERHHFDLDEEPQIVRFMNTTGG